MEFEDIKKLKFIPLIYFPIISWFYIVEKTDSLLHFLVLVSLLIMSYFMLEKIKFLVEQFNKEDVKVLKESNKIIGILLVVGKIAQFITPKNLKYYGAYLLLYIGFSVMAFWELLQLMEYKLAWLLISIGPIYICLFLMNTLETSLILYLMKKYSPQKK